MSYDDKVLGVLNSEHPANKGEVDPPQITIDEWYYEELVKKAKLYDRLKKIYAQNKKNLI